MEKYEEIDKLDAAKRQLIVAIRIFFERKDPIAVHTLATASQGILIDLGKVKDIKSFLIDSDMIRPEKRKEVNLKFRQAQNYLKHADNDPETKLKYYPEFTPFFLFDACCIYEKLTGTNFAEMVGLISWFYIKYPDLLIEGEIKKQLLELMECFRQGHLAV
ncbi:MAG: hypothetical protein IH964_12625 [Candidatus Dadabacteria bacterium]|nr:hypothetical protein [Candidatus Dadabacteria bacterium]